jgi:hypothetical protein
MTPSLPTFSMARAMSSPISRSPLAEMVPTCAKVAGVGEAGTGGALACVRARARQQ